MSAGHDEAESFDAAVHLDRYLVEEQVSRLAESADAARSTWERLRSSARPSLWEGEDDLFDPVLTDELDTLIFAALQTAEIAWKLLDDDPPVTWASTAELTLRRLTELSTGPNRRAQDPLRDAVTGLW